MICFIVGVAVVAAAGPVTRLYPAYPNPFNPTTVVPYELGASARVELAIFDGSGRRVRTLVEGRREAGLYRVLWNGTDQRGRTVAGGVYFCRLWTDTGPAHVIRLILLK
jgi:hypothetical protein